MAKKGLLVLALAVIVAGAGFADIALSAGGGAVYSGDFTAGITLDAGVASAEIEMPSHGFGAYGFFDATYVEVSASLLWGTLSIGGSSGFDLDTTTLSLGLLGKYPIHLGKIVLFPAAGIVYNYVLSAAYESTSFSDASDLSTFGLRLGVGLDFGITEKLFIRGTVLLGLNLPSKFENDWADSLKGPGYTVEQNFGFGPDIKIAVGYKF